MLTIPTNEGYVVIYPQTKECTNRYGERKIRHFQGSEVFKTLELAKEYQKELELKGIKSEICQCIY